MNRIFLDGALNTPGCVCGPDCEMPCWQLVGLTDDPCGACGCPAARPDEGGRAPKSGSRSDPGGRGQQQEAA